LEAQEEQVEVQVLMQHFLPQEQQIVAVAAEEVLTTLVIQEMQQAVQVSLL
jgi:hypothetical protein